MPVVKVYIYILWFTKIKKYNYKYFINIVPLLYACWAEQEN